MLIMQLKDRIYVRNLLKNRSFSEIAGLAPLRIVSHTSKNPKEKLGKYKFKTETEFFYIVHKRLGTEIKICSFKDQGSFSKPFSPCFLDQSGKTLCFDIRSTYEERLIFTLNDRMTVRVFKVVSEVGQRSSL